MPSRDPFKNYPIIDDSNYLEINVKHLVNNEMPVAFNTALESLSVIRDVLKVAQKAGKLDQVGNRPYYLQTIQWLNKQIALSNWGSVPQISDLSQVDENIATQLNQYVTGLSSTLQTEQIYNQIETAIAINLALSKKPYGDISEETKEKFLNDLEVIAANAAAELDNKQAGINSNIESATSVGQDRITETTQAGVSSIQSERDNAVSQLKQAQSLTQWGEAYEELIREIEDSLVGKKYPPNVLSKNLRNMKKYVDELDVFSTSIARDWLVRFFKVIPLLSRNTITFLKVANSKLLSYQAKRTIAFLLLGLFVAIFSTFSVLSLLGYDKLSFLNPSEDGVWYKKLTVYIPIVIILGLSYSFAVKNYRIYCNMLDQYKHRRLVARTAQGIILSLTGDDVAGVRNTMTAAAAQALFEHKVTGHLTKKEAESLSIVELLNFGKNS